MPEVIATIITAVATTLGVSEGVAAFLLGLVSNIAMSGLRMVLAGTARPRAMDSFQSTVTGRTLTIRQPITDHRFVYGEARVGGPMVFYEATDSNDFHHVVVVLAAHPVTAIETVFLNDYPIYPDQIDGTGLVTEGRFASVVRIKKHLGADDQAADSDLVAETSAGDDHRFRGRAYVYLRMDMNPNAFPTGLPNVSARVRGKKLEDPRTSGAANWTPNAALAIRDYIATPKIKGGFGATAADIDDTFTTSAANTADEMVATRDVTMTVTAVAAAADTLSLSDERLAVQTGDRVRVSIAGSPDDLPGGLLAATDYYVIVWQERKTAEQAVKIKLATSYDNAIAYGAIDITSAGSGTITLTKTGEPRYTANGLLDTGAKRAENLRDLASAIGAVPTNPGGIWRIRAGSYAAPTVTLTEDHLRGTIKVRTKVPRRERHNTVKGIYINPFLNDGQPSDYPSVSNAAAITADAETAATDLDLPFTSRTQAAQRIARIALLAARQEITVEMPCNLAAFQVQAGDNVAITNAHMVWTAKAFEVVTSRPTIDKDGAGNPILGVDLELKETASTVYDFAAASDETQVTTPPLPTGGDIFTVDPPTALTLTSGTAELFLKADGTVVARIHAAWTASADSLLDAYELQWKESGLTAWETGRFVAPSETDAWIFDVEDGVAYDARVRAVSRYGVQSAWATASNHTVVGKTAVPANVAGFAAQQNRAAVTYVWDQVADADLAGYEIRYAAQGGFAWDAAVVLTAVTRGTRVTNDALPPGAWTVAIKAVDTSGNYSSAAATFNITVANFNEVITTATEDPKWLGLFPCFGDDYALRLGLDSREAHTGGNNGSHVNAAGLLVKDAGSGARFDHSGAGAARGLLSEAAATNLCLRSEELDQAPWNTSNVTITADATTAPDGTATMDKVVETAVTNQHLAYQLIAFAASTRYRFSMFVKAAERSQFPLLVNGAGWSATYSALFDTATETFTFPDTAPQAQGYDSLPNGIYRIWFEQTTDGSGGSSNFQPGLAKNGVRVYAGTAGEGGYMWGAQVEAVNNVSGGDRSSYIATAASTVARTVDGHSTTLSSIPRLKTPVDGSVIVRARIDRASTDMSRRLWQIDDGTANNLVRIVITSGTTVFAVILNGGISIASAIAGAIAAGQEFTVALCWHRNNFAVSLDGAAVVETTPTAAIPSGLVTERLGHDQAGANHWNGPIARRVLYDRLLTNAQLVAASGGAEFEDFILDGPSGYLVPRTTAAASALTDAQLWDQMAYDPALAAPAYEADEIDLGFDANATRIWAAIAGGLGPGESGSPAFRLEADARDASGAYDGFTPWTVGEIDGRYLKPRVAIDTGDGAEYLSGFAVTVDVPEDSIRLADQAVSAGGTLISFGTTFHATPSVDVSAQAGAGSPSAARYATWDDVTTTGVWINVFDGSGGDVGGTVTVTAVGQIGQ